MENYQIDVPSSSLYFSLYISGFSTFSVSADVRLRPPCHLLSTALTSGNRPPPSLTTGVACPADRRSFADTSRRPKLYSSHRRYLRDCHDTKNSTPPTTTATAAGIVAGASPKFLGRLIWGQIWSIPFD